MSVVSVYGVASRQCVQEYQFIHHRSRYSNKLLLGYAIDRWLHWREATPQTDMRPIRALEHHVRGTDIVIEIKLETSVAAGAVRMA